MCLRQHPARYGHAILVAGRDRTRRRGGHDHQDRTALVERVRVAVKEATPTPRRPFLVLPVESADKAICDWLLAETEPSEKT